MEIPLYLMEIPLYIMEIPVNIVEIIPVHKMDMLEIHVYMMEIPVHMMEIHVYMMEIPVHMMEIAARRTPHDDDVTVTTNHVICCEDVEHFIFISVNFSI